MVRFRKQKYIEIDDENVEAVFLGRARLRVESAVWRHVCVVLVLVVVQADPPSG